MPTPPRNSLYRAAGGPLVRCLAVPPAVPAARASTTERVVVNRFSGLAIEGFDPVAYFVDARPELGLQDFEASAGRRGLAFPQRGQPRLLCRPSRDLRSPVRRLRPDRCGARRHGGRQPAVLADLGAAALSVRPRGDPGRLCRRSRRACCSRRDPRWPAARAEAGGIEPVAAVDRASQPFSLPPGSPQAMNSGTIKSLRAFAESQAAPLASVTLPPAAVTMAWPAAMSHSRGRRKARIDIDGALRHPAEFDRRAELLRGPRRAGVNKGFGPGIAMRAADGGDPGVAGLRDAAGMDRLGRVPVDAPRPSAARRRGRPGRARSIRAPARR